MVFQRFKCPIRRAGYVPGDVQNRPWINSYSVFVQARCDGNLMKFYTTLSSSFRSNIWIIFSSKGKISLASRFLFSFFFFPFSFFFVRERYSIFFERTDATIERRAPRIIRIGAEETRGSEIAWPAATNGRRSYVKTEERFFLPPGFRRVMISSVCARDCAATSVEYA